MDYYYDILLNFQDSYCMFYEWDESDNLEFIKKIPLIHVDQKTFINFYSKVVKVTKEFLTTIENKTKLKQNKYLKYTALFSDGKNSLALEFNDDGLEINKSSLILDDELNINEFIYNINIKKIEYEIIDKEKCLLETRQEIKVKKVLKAEIIKIYENKEYSKLKYLYLEWFNELLEDINLMKDNMLNKLNSHLTDKEYSIYELIKLSYNNV